MFEIKSGDDVGSFAVSAKFMGVAMEKVELVFQVRKCYDYKGFITGFVCVFFMKVMFA